MRASCSTMVGDSKQNLSNLQFQDVFSKQWYIQLSEGIERDLMSLFLIFERAKLQNIMCL